jgi:hypothetical protein
LKAAKEKKVETKPAALPAKRGVDKRELKDVPEAEREAIRAAIIGVDLSALRKMVTEPNLIPWQRDVIKGIISDREVETKERKKAKVEAEKLVVIVPPVSPEVEAVLKYTPDEFIFNISQFSRQAPQVQKALALESLKRGITADNIDHFYRYGTMGLDDVREYVKAIAEVEIPAEVSQLRFLKTEILKTLENLYEAGESKQRIDREFKEIEEKRVREAAEKPKTPEEMEAKRKDLSNMNDKQIKDIYMESQKTNMPPWERTIIIQEAFNRGILAAIPEIAAMPEEEAMKLGIGKVKPPVDYASFVNKAGRLDRKLFDTFVSEWGLDQSKPKHKEVVDWIWTFVSEKKALPKWEELPEENRHSLDTSFRGNLVVKYKDQIDNLLSKGLIKSREAFAGEMWTKYGRQWIYVPPYELGLVKVAYPGGLSDKSWREKFIGAVMKSPYKVGMARAQELYNKYGRFGKMPPMDEFQFSSDIEAAVKKGTDPSDAEAILKLYEQVARPIVYEDLLVLFNNDEGRAKKSYEAMIEYTDIAFRPQIDELLTEISNRPEGRDRLEYIALTDNRALLAKLIAEKSPRFKPDEEGYKDFAYDELLHFLPRTQTALEHLDFIEGEVRANKDQMRVQLQLEMEKIRPTWNNIQVVSANKGSIKKWVDLKKEFPNKEITSLDFFMRYTDISKEMARNIEEAVRFADIIQIYGKDGSMSKQMIEKMVAEVKPKIEAYKAGDDKYQLSKNLDLIERLNDLYKLATEKDIINKVSVGTFLKDVDFADARAFSKGMFRIEWLYPGDYDVLKKFMETNLKIPTQAELFAMFGDPVKARFVEGMFREKVLPLGIELDDTTVIRMAETKGLGPEEQKESLLAYRSGRALPLSAIEKEKKRLEDEFKAGMRLFREIMERPLPPEAAKRIGEMKTLNATQAERVQAFGEYLTELEANIKGLEAKIDQLSREQKTLEAGRSPGKHERIEEIVKELTAFQDKRKDLYATVREVTTDRFNFLRTLPKIDYTEGQARIKYPDYVTRHVDVFKYGEHDKKDTISITLEDIYKFWVGPIETDREKFKEENKRGPLTTDVLEMEPSVAAILEEEKKTGKAVMDHSKKIAVITFMNYAKEQGAYPFEYQMAEVARALDIKDVPLFALPAETPEARMNQFKEWLRFGLTRHEIEGWSNQSKFEFVGEDWDQCEWSGEPKTREDIKSQKEHLTECALQKAKSVQSVAIQFIEPQVLQPVIEEVAENAPITPELVEVLSIAEKLKEELEKETEKSLKAMKLSEDAIKSVTRLASEKADCEARLAILSSELEIPEETITAMSVATPKTRRMVIKRKKTETEKKGKEAELERLRGELEAAISKAKPGEGKKVLEQLHDEVAETEKKLKSAIGKVERQRIASRDICFLKDEWNTIKLSISEHMASNISRAKENKDRLMASRSAGLSTETSIYQKYDKTLREEAVALDELIGFINEVEGQDPERFLCTEPEMKTVRSMTPSQVLREAEEREGMKQ